VAELRCDIHTTPCCVAKYIDFGAEVSCRAVNQINVHMGRYIDSTESYPATLNNPPSICFMGIKGDCLALAEVCLLPSALPVYLAMPKMAQDSRRTGWLAGERATQQRQHAPAARRSGIARGGTRLHASLSPSNCTFRRGGSSLLSSNIVLHGAISAANS